MENLFARKHVPQTFLFCYTQEKKNIIFKNGSQEQI